MGIFLPSSYQRRNEETSRPKSCSHRRLTSQATHFERARFVFSRPSFPIFDAATVSRHSEIGSLDHSLEFFLMKTRFLRQIAVCSALTAGVCAGAHAAGIGLHMGSDGEITQYQNFSNWLGKPVTYRLTFLDGSSWSTIASPYILGSSTKHWLASSPNRYEVISVPLMPYSGHQDMLGAIANGAYDSYYKELAQNLATKTGAPQRIILRLGWELNGKWYPWSAVDAAAEYKAAYRHVVKVMRSKCNVLRFEWNVGWGTNPKFDWTTAYPGDDVVDVVGMDVYDQWNSGWNNLLNAYEGLAFFRNFAHKHGKSEAYAEWGLSVQPSPIGHGDDTAFVQEMYNWIQAGGSNVLYANYWNTKATNSPNGIIYSDSAPVRVTVPKSAALYKKLFSR
jgi:hypothetical protein